MKIKVDFCGFHGWTTLEFEGQPEHVKDNIWQVRLSPETQARLRRQICPYSDCLCGEGFGDRDGLARYRSDDGITGEAYGQYR